MFHTEDDDEGYENRGYYHSDTLEMDRRPQDWRLGNHDQTPTQPPYQLPPYDSPGIHRRWGQPQIIPMTSIRREHGAAGPPFARTNPYADEDRYVNPGFEPIPDDLGSYSASTYDGFNVRRRSVPPGIDTDSETSSRAQGESVTGGDEHPKGADELSKSDDEQESRADRTPADAGCFRRLCKRTAATCMIIISYLCKRENLAMNVAGDHNSAHSNGSPDTSLYGTERSLQTVINIDDVSAGFLTVYSDPRRDRKRKPKALSNNLLVSSISGLSLTRFSFKKQEVSEEEKTGKLHIISELLSMSPNDRMKAIQQLTLCMNEKRQIRRSSFPEKNLPPDQTDNMISAATQFLYNTLITLKRFHEIMSETIKSIHPWQRSLKVIGGKFGTSVLSYFTFLKWLLMFNILSFLINFSFITIPQTFEKTENLFKFSGLELLTGAGYFRNTIFYYGYYSNTTIQSNSNAPAYDMQIAYFLTIAFYMLMCFLSLVYSMSKSFNENCIGVGIVAGAAARLLCCWDFNITNERTVELKKRSLSTHLKELISEKLHYKRQLSKKQRVLRIIIHLIAWIVSIGTTVLCCYIIHIFSSSNFKNLQLYLNKRRKIICIEYLGTDEEFHSWYQWLVNTVERQSSAGEMNDTLQEDHSVAGRSAIRQPRSKIWAVLTKKNSGVAFHDEAATLLLPFLVSAINLFVPLFFSIIGFAERFKYPRHEIYVLITRNVMLRMSIIVVLCYYWLEVVANHLECWETFVGEDLYRLVVMDFIFSLLGSFFGEFILSVLGTHCCRSLGVPEFDIARNVLGLIYAQTLAWIGIFFAPLLPAIQVIKFFVIFHVKKVSLIMNCQPPRKVWRASHMTTIFIFLLLFPGFVGVITLLGIVVWKKKSSDTCGPFRGLIAPYEALDSFIDRLEENYTKLGWLVWIYKNLLENSLFFFLLSTIVLAGIYLYMQIIDGRRVMVGLLQEQIAHEGKDKAFLLSKLSAQQPNKDELDISQSKLSLEKPPVSEQTLQASRNRLRLLGFTNRESPSSSHYGAPGRLACPRPRYQGKSTISDYSEDLDTISDFEMDQEQSQNTSDAGNEIPNALALILSARQQAEEEMEIDY